MSKTNQNPDVIEIGEAKPGCASVNGSVASPYTVKQRKDGVWCIYLRQYNCVVAEFGQANRYDAEVIGAILDGKP